MNFRFLGLLLLLSFNQIQSQQLTSQAEISVLTIGSGSSLNDAFGHNLFRIRDIGTDLDVTYDYGRFPFNEPGFYLNFAQGKLNYSIGKSNYKAIKDFYIWQNRTIQEQVLNLTQEEKQAISDYLKNNYKPENRAYLYDFFFDNCATKIRDVLQVAVKNTITFHKPKDFQAKTFRTLIREKVPTNTWGSVGIDIALGAVIDRQASLEEQLFLPTYIHTYFGNATLGERKLVGSEATIYSKKPSELQSNLLWSPFIIFSLIGLLIIGITYADYKKQKRHKVLDGILLVSTSLIGILILLLWFATNHSATAQNYNLLWAFPLNGILAWQVLRPQPKGWTVKFLKFLVIMLLLMSFHWVMGIQVFAPALLPLLLALMIRYVFLINYFKKSLLY